MNFRWNFRIWNTLYGISFATKPYIKERQYGFTNRCSDGKYIVCLDYDRSLLTSVIQEVKLLQKTYKLGSFFIFESSKNSYWAVCLDKVRFDQFVTMIKMTSCDEAYKYVPLNYGVKLWTLRLSEKNGRAPRLVYRVVKTGERVSRGVSEAHYELLQKFYPNLTLHVTEAKFLDGLFDVVCSTYGAEGRGV